MKKLVSMILILVMALMSIPALAETEAYGGIEGTIYWIGKMYEGDGWMAITDGAKLAAEEMGLDVSFTYPEGGELDVAGRPDQLGRERHQQWRGGHLCGPQ